MNAVRRVDITPETAQNVSLAFNAMYKGARQPEGVVRYLQYLSDIFADHSDHYFEEIQLTGVQHESA